jgi:hypothetical protein
MKMKKTILSGLLGSLLFLYTGCQMVVVSGNKLEKTAHTRLARQVDPISDSHRVKDMYNNHWDAHSQISEAEKQQDPWRIKYHNSYAKNRWMTVEGKFNSGNKYPVVLDTGASISLFVNDIHIKENKLQIHPLKSNRDSVGWGMCYLPELQIGQVTLVNWPCFYQEQHTEVQLLGLPLARDKAAIAGLQALRMFKYIAFDSIKEEVEFSLGMIFKPENSDSWAKYPFTIEEDLGGNSFLFVKIPFAGEEIELQLDTGSGRGLAVAEELWEKIRKKIQPTKLTKGKDLYPYTGWLPCKRGIIPELELGNRIVKDAMISVFPNDSLILDECPGLIGMQYFQDTVTVLDFERYLMWVKAPQSHRLTLTNSS